MTIRSVEMRGKCGWVTIAVINFLVGCEAVESGGPVTAQPGWTGVETPAMSRTQFDQLMIENSNWGRWGADDQLGTLNLITPELRRDAAALVQDGVSISLALELNKHKDELNTFPFEHEIETVEWEGHQWVGDTYSVNYHGFAHSHIDGLQHVAHQGMLYNGLPVDSLTPEGTIRLGIQNVAANGIFTRGVLVDIPRFFA